MTIYIAFLLLLLHLHLFLLFSSPTESHPHHLVHHSMPDNTTDQLALLSFKSHITHDPFGVLNTWNTNTSFCNWQGITCNIRRQRVTHLNLNDLNLEGTLSPHMTNLTFLRLISLRNNSFHGPLPADIGRLFRLRNLTIDLNYLSGPIPSSVANASNLERLVLSNNSFNGRIPLFSNMRKLRYVKLSTNELGGDSDGDMDFISSLANSNHLQILAFHGNKLRGLLPSSVGNLSKELSTLALGINQLEGRLPIEITNLVGLTMLYIDNNSFSGTIPASLGEMPILQYLSLSFNKFEGHIPESIGKLPQLYKLYLHHNNFTGTIPASLSNARQLQLIDLSHNMLIGTIPREIFSLPNLIMDLDLSSNSLSGSIPIEVGKLTMIQGLDFSNNQLTGEIPSSIGACVSLLNLRLSGNSFRGPIPNSVVNLTSIENIDLSSNNLSGQIPSTLQSLKFINLLNLSMNQLEGEVPKDGIFRNSTLVSLHGNPYICGGVSALALPKCKIPDRNLGGSKMKLIIGIVVGCMGFGILLCLLFFVFWRRNRKRSKTNKEFISFEGPHRLYTYHDLRIATENFNANNLIGEGSFGRVYKGILSEETLAAIKVFNMNHGKFLQSFNRECEALKGVRHRNLVKIISACSSSEFKALVLKFMPNGSLAQWLSRPVSEFNTTQKLKVAIDVAAAMEYLHHECETPVVHCDLKPSNVLLDEYMIAHVADFGLARILLDNPNGGPHGSTLGLKGSVGYIAPEYGMGGEASRKGDVYSYGILLLEMFTGKKPTDEMFVGELDLQKWVTAELTDRIIDIVDAELVQEDESVILASVLKVGLSCASISPKDRPTMRDVSNIINRYKKVS